ncbi:MAG: hypothetical protein ACRDFX_14100, partial [Chloroflexota bacterium]
VSAGLSGFVVGVFVTLAASGVLARTSGHAAPVATPIVTRPVVQSVLWTRVHKIVTRELGPFTDAKQNRFVSLGLSHVHDYEVTGHQPAGDVAAYRSVSLVFRLNDHPLGKVWRVRAARADVFTVMKGLYVSGLPIYDIHMIGLFALPSNGKKRETEAVRVYESYAAANRIPWKRWGREHETALWNSLSFKYVDPRFG